MKYIWNHYAASADALANGTPIGETFFENPTPPGSTPGAQLNQTNTMKMTAQEAKAEAEKHNQNMPSAYLYSMRSKISSAAKQGGMRTTQEVPNDHAEFCIEQLKGDGFTVSSRQGSFTTLLDVSWEDVAPC